MTGPSGGLGEITPASVAGVMGLTVDAAWRMGRILDKQFLPDRPRLIKGKRRTTRGPKWETKLRLRKLHRFLQGVFPSHSAVHGGARGRSCVTSANLHVGAKVVISRDAKDCYPSITTKMLRNRLLNLGFRPDTAKLLSLLMTIDGRVPLGSPISSDALNMFFYQADATLARRLGRKGIRYGRTYDDLVASADTRRDANQAGRLLEEAIEGLGLEVNQQKKRTQGLQPSHTRQLVHNIQTNDSRGTKAIKEQREAALAVAEGYVKGAKSVSPESLEGLARRRMQLTGWIHHFRQLHFAPAKHLRRQLEAGDHRIAARLAYWNLSSRKNKWWLISRHRNEPRELARVWRKRLKEQARTPQ